MHSNKQIELANRFVQYTGQSIFLTGKAGTGKTTFLKNLKEKSPKRMIVVAPTGVAAINAGGVTIHSFFQLSFAPQLGVAKEHTGAMRFSKEKIKIIRGIELLVIDEISMVRADILDAIDRVLRRFKDRKRPFGGIQLLLIGDLQQLSPVVRQADWDLLKSEYDTAYFFGSKALRQTTYISIELTEVYRQQDDHFLTVLNKVRNNTMDEEALTALNSRYLPEFQPSEDEGYITLCTHNASAQKINDSRLNGLSSGEEVYAAVVEGKFPEYAYPTSLVLKLKKGAQVMFVRNDPEPEKRFFNGKIGQVTRLENEVVYVKCPGEEEEIEVTPLTWENMKYSIDKRTAEITEKVEGSFCQVPLKLAWAITIHKSQGLTFDKAIIDAGSSFAHGQVYVALSRCRSLEGMVLKTRITASSIINDGKVSSFTKGVEENQPGEKEFELSKWAYQRDLLLELFRFYRMMYLVRSINKMIDENKGSFTDLVMERFAKMQAELQTDLIDVADKFQLQLRNMIHKSPDIEDSRQIQDRIQKASSYFAEKIAAVVMERMDDSVMDIDNLALKRQFKSRVNDLKEEAELKLALYEECSTGFSIDRILSTKANVLLSTKKAEPKKRKAKPVSETDEIPNRELFDQLRSYRMEKATEMNVPAYMIFSQKSLIELVTYLPSDSKELGLINGLGVRKIEQFGEDILQMIGHYCTENNIQKGRIALQ